MTVELKQPLSNDTSRSPIPIDNETYQNMHKQLPTRMDASSNTQGNRSRGQTANSYDPRNADIRNITGNQPFLIGPQNLDETLMLPKDVTPIIETLNADNTPVNEVDKTQQKGV